MTIEYVKIDGCEFHCLCGNNPNAQGAYASECNGVEIPEDLNFSGTYCCDRCGRVFDVETGKVVGMRS